MSAILARRPHPPVQAVRLCNRPCQLELGERPCDTRSAQARGRGSAGPPRLARSAARRARRPRARRVRRARLRLRRGNAERLEHVAGARQRRRAEPEQRVGPGRQRRGDLTGHREDLPTRLEREVGRDQRAASLARLDDHGRSGKPGDDPVPGREPPRRRLDPGRVLRGDEAPLADSPRELGMRGRIVAVDAAAEDRDRQPAGLERSSMRLAVDASGKAAERRRGRRRPAPGRAAARPGRRTTSRRERPTIATAGRRSSSAPARTA